MIACVNPARCADDFGSEVSPSCPLCGGTDIVPHLSAPDRFHGRDVPFKLLRCRTCTLVWLADPPPVAEIGLHYGRDYDQAVRDAGSRPERWKSHASVVYRYRSSGAILDLGCSAGGFLQALKDSNLKGSAWRLHGIEMSQEVAAFAMSATGAKVYVGDILDAPFPAQSFDVITCFHVLEHVFDPAAVVEKVAQWLKPGGVFYLIVPNIDSAAARIFGSFWYGLELPRHLYHFSPRSLVPLLSAHGLIQHEIRTTRALFVEESTHYLRDQLLRLFGASPTPLAQARPPGIPFRALRKLYRLTILPVINLAAYLAGRGEILHAVFEKPATEDNCLACEKDKVYYKGDLS